VKEHGDLPHGRGSTVSSESSACYRPFGCVASVQQIKPRLIDRRSALASLGLYALFFFVFMLPPGRILLGSL
jgi:hypothetical protein